MQHSQEFLKLAEGAKKNVKEVTVEQTKERVLQGATLIDVREDNEWEASHAKGAIHLGRGIIERDIVQAIPDKSRELILYCGGGFRSALSADNLQKMGYNNIYSMDGGWKAWYDAGGEVE